MVRSEGVRRFPRGPPLDRILKDLRVLVDHNPVLKSIDLTNSDIEKPDGLSIRSSVSSTRRRDVDESSSSSEAALENPNSVAARVSSPRLPLDRLAGVAFRGLRQLESLSLETRVFAGFPYVPSISAQPWARFLKRLSLKLAPREQVKTRKVHPTTVIAFFSRD